MNPFSYKFFKAPDIRMFINLFCFMAGLTERIPSETKYNINDIKPEKGMKIRKATINDVSKIIEMIEGLG